MLLAHLRRQWELLVLLAGLAAVFAAGVAGVLPDRPEAGAVVPSLAVCDEGSEEQLLRLRAASRARRLRALMECEGRSARTSPLRGPRPADGQASWAARGRHVRRAAAAQGMMSFCPTRRCPA